MRKDENYEKYGKFEGKKPKSEKKKFKKADISESSEYTKEEAEAIRLNKQINKNVFLAVTAGVLISLGFAAVIFIVFVKMGFITINKFNADGTRRDTTSSESTDSKLSEINSKLSDFYYGNLDYDNAKEEMYKAYVSSFGDEYTTYYTAEEFSSTLDRYDGQPTGGIGVLFQKTEDNTGVVINKVYDDSAAASAGLVAGDTIVKVDDVDITSMSADEVKSRITGDVDTDVKIEYKHNDETKTATLKRGIIHALTVQYGMLENEDGVGYIAISSFTSVTSEQFKEALEELNNKGMKSLVIDLRNNSGGLVNAARDVLAQILKESDFGYVEYKDGSKTEIVKSDNESVDVPIAVLVNQNTASSSEIVVAAIKDYNAATIVGETTYGKGITQKITALSDGSGIKYTDAQIFSPTGWSWNKEGIKPDVEVSLEQNSTEDTQLNAAIEQLKK